MKEQIVKSAAPIPMETNAEVIQTPVPPVKKRKYTKKTPPVTVAEKPDEVYAPVHANICVPSSARCEDIIRNVQKAGSSIMLAEVPVELLDIDPSYQRSAKRYKAIAAHWDKKLAGVIVVSYRDGRFYIVDGQHRYMAALMKDESHMTAMIYTDLTKEQEAIMFAKQDDLTRPVNWHEKLNAFAVGNEPVALKVKAVCAKYGVETALVNKAQLGGLTAPKAAIQICENSGEEMLDDIFALIKANGWRMKRKAYNRNILYAARDLFVKHKDMDPAEVITIVARKCGNEAPITSISKARVMYPEAKTAPEALCAMWSSYIGDPIDRKK